MTKITAALCGNPNSGKTTLFNRLTGSNQKVGNWAGVTVERKHGVCVLNRDITITDTPGVYSLTPYSPDEQITVDYLNNAKPDLIINIVDATNLERNLLLTTQLLDTGIPVVVALNLKDDAEAKGIVISPQALSTQLHCPVFYISAAKNLGIDELIKYCAQPINNTNGIINFPADITERYAKITKIVNIVRQTDPNRTLRRVNSLTAQIDKAVLNKWLAFPIFMFVMAAVFYLSVGSVGKWITTLINTHFTPLLQKGAANLLASSKVPWLTSLVCDGIINGVMGVAGFVPQIMILFGCISALEASGYMSRIAFITDRALNKIGLGGRSFVSMVLGCGCSVPAVMSARTIKNTDERNATIALTPFVPCSAKLAVISFFTSAMFNGNALFALGLYTLSGLSVIIGGLIFKTIRRHRCGNEAFIMELPDYRLPTAKNILKQMWERGKAFLIKAGTVIFASSVVLWTLQNFNFRFETVTAENSMLSHIGRALAPLFSPLGFGDKNCGWQFSVAALSGIVAKETVVTTLEMLLPAGIENSISPLGAFCFVLYNLLTAPCIATISATFAEQKFKQGLKTLIFQITLSYVVSLIIYQTVKLAQNHTDIFLIAAIAISVILAVVFSVLRFTKHGCNGCSGNACKKCKH